MTEQLLPKPIPLALIDVEATPMLYANQFVIQHQQDEFILTVAQIQPPFLTGTEEERKHQLQAIEYVPAKVVARLVLTPARLKELLNILQTNLARYEQKRAMEGSDAGRDIST